MSLSNLIRKRSGPIRFATATPATFATQEAAKEGTVASVATVTVANPLKDETAEPSLVGATETTMRPFDPLRQRFPALSDSDEKRILAWLASIGETDAVTIGEVIDKCRGDLEARSYFIVRANETDRAGNDDRHFCRECQNLRGGICTIARPGGLVSAQRGYRPVPVKHRCAGFLSENNIP